jgi:hypothetical protein
MSQRRKHKLPLPIPNEFEPSSAEIVDAPGKRTRAFGTPVELVAAGPPLEIIEAPPRGPKPDPDRSLVPTEAELANLPRWARLGFAARCARRLLPLLSPDKGASQSELVSTIAALVTAVEQSAANARIQKRAMATAYRAVQVFQTYAPLERDVLAAAVAAYHGEGCRAARCAVETLERLATVRTLRLVLTPRKDFDRIVRTARRQAWTDDTPVSPESFGPLWDHAPPSWMLQIASPDASTARTTITARSKADDVGES